MRDIDQALVPAPPMPPCREHDVATRRFQGIPGVQAAPSGKLWATWYTGGVTEGPENYVVLAESSDGGVGWKESFVVDPPGHVRAYDSTLWLDPKGRLWWFWSQSYSREDGLHYDGRAGVWACVADNPDRPAWSPPVRLANGVMMNKPCVLSNGDWVFPTSVWADQGYIAAPPLPELKDECHLGMTVSSDQGRSFTLRGGADIPFRCFAEHSVVELEGGRLWMLARTHYGIGQSFSTDQGRTWTPGCDSLLGGPNSRFFVRRLRSGRLLLVNHIVDPFRPSFRKELMAKLSEDDGKTWIGGLMVDARDEVSYPDGAQAADGSLWIVHDRLRFKGGFIHLSRITEEDILGKRLVSACSKLGMTVSEYPFPRGT